MRPEFFLDRSLGRGVADGLVEHGWLIHRAIARREPATYAVTVFGIRRTWP